MISSDIITGSVNNFWKRWMPTIKSDYTLHSKLMAHFFNQALKKLKIDRAGILLLDWHNQPPSNRILDRALAVHDKGMFQFPDGHQGFIS